MRPAKVLSFLSILVLLVAWAVASKFELFRTDLFPRWNDFIASAAADFASGRLLDDVFASVFRWACGFLLAGLVGIPAGLVLGKSPSMQDFLEPYLNLFRSLSPLAWIPFAVIWFGIGDLPVVFLIFLGCVFPLLFTTLNAVLSVPKVYDQLARDYHFSGSEYFFEILFPAVLPQIISSLRLVAGLGWIVLVPAEMLAGKEGVGFAILDARNGLRTDLLVLNMFAIALLGNIVDRALLLLNQKAKVKWSYEQ